MTSSCIVNRIQKIANISSVSINSSLYFFLFHVRKLVISWYKESVRAATLPLEEMDMASREATVNDTHNDHENDDNGIFKDTEFRNVHFIHD